MGANRSRASARVRSHIPTAAARLIAASPSTEDSSGHNRRARHQRTWLDVLDAGTDSLDVCIVQSAVLALGRTTRPVELGGDEGSLDAIASSHLRDYAASGSDAYARCPARIALAMIGGTANRSALLERLPSDGPASERPWTALAMLSADSAAADLEDLLEASHRRPERMRDCAAAVALLGEPRAAGFCVEQLGRPLALATLAALAQALGVLDARESVPPLIVRLSDSSQSPIHRAFAAATLGCLVARDRPEWSAELAFGFHDLAAVPPLTDQVRGILDLP